MLEALEDVDVSAADGRCSCLRSETARSGADVREAVARVMGGEMDLAERRTEETSG